MSRALPILAITALCLLLASCARTYWWLGDQVFGPRQTPDYCGQSQSLALTKTRLSILETSGLVSSIAGFTGAMFERDRTPIAEDLTAHHVFFGNFHTSLCGLTRDGRLTGEQYVGVYMNFSQSLGPSALVDGILDRMVDEGQLSAGLNLPRATEIAAAAGSDTTRLHQLSMAARAGAQQVWDSVFVDQPRIERDVRESLVLIMVRHTSDAGVALPYILGALETAEARVEALARDTERRLETMALEIDERSATRFMQNQAVIAGRPYFNVLAVDTVLFALGTDRVTARRADALVEWAHPYAESRFTFSVVGSADATGPPRLNQLLADRRAQAVVKLLVERVGIPPARISAVGVGETASDPIVARNRRAVVAVHGVPD